MVANPNRFVFSLPHAISDAYARADQGRNVFRLSINRRTPKHCKTRRKRCRYGILA